MKKCAALLLLFAVACTTTAKKESEVTKYDPTKDVFLTEQVKDKNEIFRVLMTGDVYLVGQKGFENSIARSKDDSGDTYFMGEIKNLNKISETREGVVGVWLYPDSGKLEKVRFLRSTFIRELDAMILEDIQRWNYDFKNKRVDPRYFTVHYKIILEKMLSEEEMLQEMRQSIKEKTGQ